MTNARPHFRNEDHVIDGVSIPMIKKTEFVEAMIVLSAKAPAHHLIALSRPIIWTTGMPTAGTDGIHIYINPSFFLSLPNASQRGFLIAHEVGHIVFGHMRRGKVFSDRGYLAKGMPFDHSLYNQSADYIINADLVSMGLEFIECGLLSQDITRNDVTEEVYAKLWNNKPEQPEQPQDDSGDAGQGQGKGQPDGQDGSDGQQSGSDGDSQGGQGDDQGDDSGDSTGDSAGDSTGAQQGQGSGQGQGAGERSDDADSGDSTATDGSTEESPQSTPHIGHDEHFEPIYDGTDAEVEERKQQDQDIVEREIDRAIETAASQGHGVSDGFAANSKRHKGDDVEVISQDWREKIIDHLHKPAREGVPTWSRIHRRRYSTMGIVTPSTRGKLERLAIINDISYSVDRSSKEMFDHLLAEAIDQLSPANGAIVIHAGGYVAGTDEVYSGAEYLEIDTPDGGGTYLSSGLDWMDENDEHPDAIIVFTDAMLLEEDAQRLVQAGALIVVDTYRNWSIWKDELGHIPNSQVAVITGE